MSSTNCSGLLGRTSLRRLEFLGGGKGYHDCSGLLGRTSLRHKIAVNKFREPLELFRPSRPDFIETRL